MDREPPEGPHAPPAHAVYDNDRDHLPYPPRLNSHASDQQTSNTQVPMPSEAYHPAALSRELPQLPPYGRLNGLSGPAHPPSHPPHPQNPTLPPPHAGYRSDMNGLPYEVSTHSAPPGSRSRMSFQSETSAPGEVAPTSGPLPTSSYMPPGPPISPSTPGPYGPSYYSNPAYGARQRTAARAQQACNQCRAKKRKCDEGQPVCSYCKSQQQQPPQSLSQSPFQPQSQQPRAQGQAQHQHQYQHLPHPPPPTAIPIPRPEVPGTPSGIDASLRKRPLYPAEKPLAPRAIQPRPPASTASYSSGSTAQFYPRLETSTGEPPRKRGRPSKAETERRRAAAEARGETYPPPRGANSIRMEIHPSPTSPAGLYPAPTATGPPPHPVHGPNAGLIPYDVPGPRPLAPATSIQGATSSASSNPNLNLCPRHDRPTRSIGPMRELSRPTEIGHPGHPLPSPHSLQLGTLQLGPPNPFGRLKSNPGERSAYGAIPPDRSSPPDSGRRDSVASRGERDREREREGMGSYVEARSSTTLGEQALK